MDGQPAESMPRYPQTELSGTGLGLRSQHIDRVLTEQPPVPWFEVLADNHTAPGGLVPRQLAAVRSNYPITLHCVGMSLGGTDPLDLNYLRGIRRLIDSYEPILVSDHLCFSSHASHQYHDLLPLPFTEESLQQVSQRIRQVQDILDMRILVENVSSYLTYRESTLSENQFLAALTELTDCDLLLDLNNAYVNEVNHGIPASTLFDELPLERVREVHMAGFEDKGDYLIDAHNNRVAETVWSLFGELMGKLPEVPVLIEWDNDIPALEVLIDEANRAEQIRSTALSTAA